MSHARPALARIVVLISGNGSNLQAILDACADNTIAGAVVAVVSNRPGAYGLERARLAGVPTAVSRLKDARQEGKTREQYDSELAARVAAYEPDLIVLAGWMHILSPAFLDQFPRQVVNLHPALPGEFDGVRAIERAWQAGQSEGLKRTGVMVHWVIAEVDAGEVIDSVEVPLEPGEPLDALAKRIHQVEHVLLVRSVARLAHERCQPSMGAR